MLVFNDGYDIAQLGRGPSQRYDDDLLLANWNPAVALLATFHDTSAHDTRSDAARDPIIDDDEGFLDRVYAHATHI